MYFLLAFLVLFKVTDPIKFYKEGKYQEFLKAYYSDPKFNKSINYIPYVALTYLNLGQLDSALAFYKRIPVSNLVLKNLDGLSYQIAERLKEKGSLKEAAEAYYYSYLGGYRSEESKKAICQISNIPEELVGDSVLKNLFTRAKVYIVAPFSGEYSDIGQEFYSAFTLIYNVDVEKIDEENRENLSRILPNSIVIGPLKRSTSKYLDSLYQFPTIWFSPFTEYLPLNGKLFFSPFKTLMEETNFLVGFIFDSLKLSRVALIRDTSSIEGLFANYLKSSMASRGKFLFYDLRIVNPFEFDSVAASIDSEKIDVAIISGLSDNSYFLYSAFKTMFPGKPVLGTFAWMNRITQVPKYRLDLTICGIPVSMGQIFRNSELLENFVKDFQTKNGYYPSEIGLAGLDMGILLKESADSSIIGTLINLKNLSGYVGPSGAVYDFSGKLSIYEIVKGEIKRREESYGGEEN